jgi:Tol biopolymer transport system component
VINTTFIRLIVMGCLLFCVLGCNSVGDKPARLVFYRYELDSDEVFIVEEGNDELILVSDDATGPLPSSNGQSILFSHHPSFNLRKFDVATGEVESLGEQGAGHILDYHWSSDSQQIVFTRRTPYMNDADIYVINSDGTNERQLTDLNGVGQLAWSPDSSTIAYTTYDRARNRGYVWLISVNGGTPHQVVTFRESHYDISLSWSPDGSTLLYACGASPNPRFCTVDVSEPNTNPIYVGEGTQATWSPDGTQVVFSRALEESDSRIFIWTLESGDIRDVTQGSYPAWSPDGSEIAFVNEGIYILDLAEGAEPRLITKDEGQPHWIITP